MIDQKYTQSLYDALCKLVDATNHDDVMEVGGQPLQDAWGNAARLLNEIEAPEATVEDTLSAALEFIAGCQNEEAEKLTCMLAKVLNSLRESPCPEGEAVFFPT